MRRYFLLALTLFLMPLAAQHGHPLVGTWHGTWGQNANQRNDITVVFFWDGKTITGMVNPGLDVMKMRNATLDPGKWAIHFETATKDKSGAAVPVVADGVIEDVVNPKRSISGTWTQGAVKGDFKIVRDN